MYGEEVDIQGVFLKINKHAINSDKNLYIGGIYLPPFDSNYAFKNIFETMEKEISDYLEQGHLLALGDLNARTGSLPDFLMNYKGDNKIDLLYFDSDVEPNKRFNSDTVTHDYGKKFINTDRLILSGRTDGDIDGRFTYNSHIGNSTIDYAVISSQIVKDIVYFHVK